jgi:hypothetical protein
VATTTTSTTRGCPTTSTRPSTASSSRSGFLRGQRTSPLGGHRIRECLAGQPDSHPCPARQRQVATLDDVVTSYQRVNGLGFQRWRIGRPTHQRQRTVLLRAHALRVRMGGRLEPDRRRRIHLETNTTSGHQHLGAHAGRANRDRQARSILGRRTIVGPSRRRRGSAQRPRDRRRLIVEPPSTRSTA